MRLPGRISLTLLTVVFAGISAAAAREAFLTSGAKTSVQPVGWGANKREILTFNYGELELTVPRPTTNWFYNPMMLRPQLLLLRCPPVSYPTTIQIELLADNKREKGQGYQFSLLDPGSIAQHYAKDARVTPTASLGMPGVECFSYKELPPANAAPGSVPRVEIHVIKLQNVGFRLRMVLQPQLLPKDEELLRQALSNMTFKGFNVATKSDANDISFIDKPPPPEPVRETITYVTNVTTVVTTQIEASASAPAQNLEPGPGDISLLEKALIKQRKRIGDSGTTIIYNYNFKDLEISLAPPFSWAPNSLVTRPELLRIQNGPAGSQSFIHLDLLGRRVQGTAEAWAFKLVTFTNAVEAYSTNSEWVASKAPLPVLGMTGVSFQRGDASKGEPLEVVHLMNTGNLTFRLRENLSPQIKPADSAAIYKALSNLTIKVTAGADQTASSK
jgi:hypothetical protein